MDITSLLRPPVHGGDRALPLSPFHITPYVARQLQSDLLPSHVSVVAIRWIRSLNFDIGSTPACHPLAIHSMASPGKAHEPTGMKARPKDSGPFVGITFLSDLLKEHLYIAFSLCILSLLWAWLYLSIRRFTIQSCRPLYSVCECSSRSRNVGSRQSGHSPTFTPIQSPPVTSAASKELQDEDDACG